eukprot:comp13782_c0_seq1/m.19385 comp13782_c0_seq1/g.19385  ORF comp13782_c0_seq1/g.19385 comp13782_c0_seq1/m.19385 type:complete len:111 (-) comp13782_c0_seq1:149-481(-)
MAGVRKRSVSAAKSPVRARSVSRGRSPAAKETKEKEPRRRSTSKTIVLGEKKEDKKSITKTEVNTAANNDLPEAYENSMIDYIGLIVMFILLLFALYAPSGLPKAATPKN